MSSQQNLDYPKPEMLTENGANSYSTCFNARVELFFKAVRGLTGENLTKMLDASWNESPLDTLKLIYQTRDCRGGKGERTLFLEMISWLCGKNKSSCLANLELVPEYGRWLDLVQMSENEPIKVIIWTLLAKTLRDDHALMMEGKPISLCAKWIPSEGSKWDRKLKINYHIAKSMDINQATLRKTYLTPLRSYLKIVESYMCSGNWDQIDYNKVPSCAMHKLKTAFARHDPQRFNEWRQALISGKPDAKVNANVLFPHELVRVYLNGKSQHDDILQAQWNVLMEECKKLGNFGRSLAICDVSGSMQGTPMEVSIALGIMISQCCDEPFKGKIITFSENPDFHNLKGNTLFEQTNCLRSANWGMNTDFIAVFKLILDKAKEHGVPPEKMPNRLYVFSDMQFDCARIGPVDSYRTNYETMQTMYQQYGYQLPEIVFWNLRGDTVDFPIGDSTEQGVAMVSGFTTSILKALLNGKDLSPVTVLRDVIDSPRYQSIRYIEN